MFFFFFFFNDTATTEIYTLSLHDALPIFRRKRSSPNVFEMAATETITSIILIKLIRVSLGTVRHPRRFKIVVIDIQITLKQMLRDFKAPWMPDRTEANPNELNQDEIGRAV